MARPDRVRGITVLAALVATAFVNTPSAQNPTPPSSPSPSLPSETPFAVFNQGLLTANDAFFVRYHLSQVPTSIDPEKFTLRIDGAVDTRIVLSLEDLKAGFDHVYVHQIGPDQDTFFRFYESEILPKIPSG